MKKTLLIIAAIFIATQLFSQDVEKITITYNKIDLFYESGNINTLQLLNQQPYEINVGPEQCTRIIDIKNMQVTFYSDAVDTVYLDIVKYEKLDNGIFHIVCNERNILYPEEDNIRILTNTYVDIENNLSVYSYIWGDDQGQATFANKAINPKIQIQ